MTDVDKNILLLKKIEGYVQKGKKMKENSINKKYKKILVY